MQNGENEWKKKKENFWVARKELKKMNGKVCLAFLIFESLKPKWKQMIS